MGPIKASTQRQAALDEASRQASLYLENVTEAPVAPPPSAVAKLSALGGALPEAPEDPVAVVRMLAEIAGPATVANAGGRFYGFVNGGTVPAALGAAWLASTWDQNGAMRAMSPAGAFLEETALEWARDLLGLPQGCGGGVVTGATMANFCGLLAARHALLERAGWDVEAKGLFGAPELRVVVGAEVHAALIKALGMTGLGRERIVRAPVDDQGRILAGELPALDERTILCIQAGNVNSGSFDPAPELCAAAKRAGAWTHVDGAFGLWAAASPQYRHLMAGFDGADSWATDAHKWPNVGYDCGIVFVREPQHLRAAVSLTAAYLPPGALREPMHYTPESSRRARGVELWAALRSLGREGMASLVERCCAHAQRFADGLRHAGLPVLNDVVINQVVTEFGSAERTREVIRRIQEDGTCWCGGTEWQGKTAMRISVSSWMTTTDDVDRSLEAILKAASF